MENGENGECSGCGVPISECRCGKPRVVVCAANRSKVTGKIIAGARHWDSVMRQQVAWLEGQPGDRKMPDEWAGAEQGFIDQYGQFMTREEAWSVAERASQIKYANRSHEKGVLFSEDIY